MVDCRASPEGSLVAKNIIIKIAHCIWNYIKSLWKYSVVMHKSQRKRFDEEMVLPSKNFDNFRVNFSTWHRKNESWKVVHLTCRYKMNSKFNNNRIKKLQKGTNRNLQPYQWTLPWTIFHTESTQQFCVLLRLYPYFWNVFVGKLFILDIFFHKRFLLLLVRY